MRKQHFGIFVFQKLLIVTVTDYAADCFIECSLMLRISEAIDKDKICVSVNGSDTMKIEQLLPFLFHYNCLFHKTEHWHFSLSSRSFRRIDIEVAAFFASIGAVVIVNQSMIYINNTVLQIDITPS